MWARNWKIKAIDRLLDKVSQDRMPSLSNLERKKLERFSKAIHPRK
jgi:hypothetical protein